LAQRPLALQSQRQAGNRLAHRRVRHPRYPGAKFPQRRAKVVGCADPGAELVARRLRVLSEHRWSWWRVYAGLEAAPAWLTRVRIQSGCGGRRLKEQRAALIAYTEGPIRQGRLESPWEGLVAGVVLGNGAEAAALLGGAERNPEGQAQMRRKAAARVRPEWAAIVPGAELILGREWAEMAEGYGDWGREGTMAVATRHLGWRLVEVVRQVRGLSMRRRRRGFDVSGAGRRKMRIGRHSHVN